MKMPLILPPLSKFEGNEGSGGGRKKVKAMIPHE